jgi:hypothetical protein
VTYHIQFAYREYIPPGQTQKVGELMYAPFGAPPFPDESGILLRPMQELETLFDPGITLERQVNMSDFGSYCNHAGFKVDTLQPGVGRRYTSQPGDEITAKVVYAYTLKLLQGAPEGNSEIRLQYPELTKLLADAWKTEIKNMPVVKKLGNLFGLKNQ